VALLWQGKVYLPLRQKIEYTHQLFSSGCSPELPELAVLPINGDNKQQLVRIGLLGQVGHFSPTFLDYTGFYYQFFLRAYGDVALFCLIVLMIQKKSPLELGLPNKSTVTVLGGASVSG